jgi:REP element-mobilizing transposase RayT
MTPHRARPVHRAAEPVHVTLRARLAPLRSQFLFPTVRLALVRAARRDPEHFRVVHFSIQRDHVHLIVEAADERTLSSGVRGVAIRIARYVNDLLGRRGSLWADRWHGHALRSPREVRNAIIYVLMNFRKHGCREQPETADPYSSAPWFDGWRGGRLDTARAACERRIFVAQTWLLRVGWRRDGLIGFGEKPVGARVQARRSKTKTATRSGDLSRPAASTRAPSSRGDE